MKFTASHTYPVVHLAIDVQEHFYIQLENHLASDYPLKVRAFSDSLWKIHRIPTIVIGVTDFLGDVDSYKLCADEITDPSANNAQLRQDLVNKHYLDILGLRRHETLLIKTDNSAFRAPKVKTQLTEWSSQHLICSGMNTTACIPDSLGDAVRDYSCTVAYDLLADVNRPEGRSGPEPEWHLSVLRTKMSWLPSASAEKITYTLSNDLLRYPAAFGKQPQPPLPQQTHFFKVLAR